MPRQGVRDQHLSIQPLDEVRQPTGWVHGRADDRKIPVLNCSPDLRKHGSPVRLTVYYGTRECQNYRIIG